MLEYLRTIVEKANLTFYLNSGGPGTTLSVIMLLAGTDSIRDVIAFPKVKDASDLMSDAPSVVDEKQLDELHLQITED